MTRPMTSPFDESSFFSSFGAADGTCSTTLLAGFVTTTSPTLTTPGVAVNSPRNSCDSALPGSAMRFAFATITSGSMELGTRTSYETSYRVVFASDPADKKRNLRTFGPAASFVEVAFLVVVVALFVLVAFLVVVACLVVVAELNSVAESFATCL